MFKHLSIKSWFTGKTPPSWLHSIVVPISKPSQTNPRTYRPPTGQYPLPAMCANSLKKWSYVDSAFLEYHKILSISQSGVRQRRKTTDHILCLHDAIKKSLGNKHNVLSAFIGLEKAYDMVNKDLLLSKRLRYGISGRMFRFIHSFLSNRTFQVRFESTLSLAKERYSSRKRP